MYNVVNSESILNAIRSALNKNAGDESTEYIIISIACEILDVSEDKLLELLDI